MVFVNLSVLLGNTGWLLTILILFLRSIRVQLTSDLHHQDDVQRRGPKCHLFAYWKVCALPHPGTGLASSFEDDGSAQWDQG